jgi:hypothetical protein
MVDGFASASLGINGAQHVPLGAVKKCNRRSTTSEELRLSLSRRNCTAPAIDSANYDEANECSSQFTRIASRTCSACTGTAQRECGNQEEPKPRE